MPFRFAILGAGRIGQVHARAVDGNDKAVLAAVFDPVESAAASVAEKYGAEIRDLDAIAAADDIDAVQNLTDAETIWFAASGRSKPVTVYMSYVLTKLGIRSQEFREAKAEAMRELNLVGPRDVLMAISFAPYGELTVKLAQEAAGRGIKIISITDTMVSPVALDTTLLVTEENIFGFRSLCATMNLAQYLAIETGLKRDKDVRNA